MVPSGIVGRRIRRALKVSHSPFSSEDTADVWKSRFISNLSQEELASPERVCFQIEQAYALPYPPIPHTTNPPSRRHWFYEDFIREAQPTLPTYRLKDFCKIFFAHSPLLSSQWGSDAESERAFERFLVYKKRVPVCGAIMLNTEWTKVSSRSGRARCAVEGLCRWTVRVVCFGQGLEVGQLVGISEREDEQR